MSSIDDKIFHGRVAYLGGMAGLRWDRGHQARAEASGSQRMR